MITSLSFDIRRQPDAITCGPTCLHALYRYYGDPIGLGDVIAQVSPWQQGGTLAVYLAIHALRRGYGSTILPYNLTVFDPTWRDIDSRQMARKLEAQLPHKKEEPGFEEVTRAYLEYLALGGRIQFRVITPALIRKYLKAGIPILTGLSATYLYDCPREREHNGGWLYDDVGGDSCGHFVVLSGYNKESRRVRVADPLVPNPMADGRYYEVDIYRLVCAIMLGILTYDGNLLIIKKKKKS
ncbi:MAG: hypothetical protein PVJ84_18025 [Desulfobacteraceae bacterium]|jgi:hypothetical protein